MAPPILNPLRSCMPSHFDLSRNSGDAVSPLSHSHRSSPRPLIIQLGARISLRSLALSLILSSRQQMLQQRRRWEGTTPSRSLPLHTYSARRMATLEVASTRARPRARSPRLTAVARRTPVSRRDALEPFSVCSRDAPPPTDGGGGGGRSVAVAPLPLRPFSIISAPPPEFVVPSHYPPPTPLPLHATMPNHRECCTRARATSRPSPPHTLNARTYAAPRLVRVHDGGAERVI